MAAVCQFCRQVFALTSRELLVLEELMASGVCSADKGVESKSREAVTRPQSSDLETPASKQPCSKKPKLSPLVEHEVTTPKLSPLVEHEVTTPPNLPTDSCLDHVCVCCLDLNQDSFIDHLVRTILQELEEAGYRGVTSFVLAVHAPLSLKVRRMGMESLMRHIREDMSSSVADNEGEGNELTEPLNDPSPPIPSTEPSVTSLVVLSTPTNPSSPTPTDPLSTSTPPLTNSLSTSSSTLTDTLSTPPSTLTDTLSTPPSTLTNSLSTPPSTFTDLLSTPPSTLTDSLSTTSSTLTDSLSTSPPTHTYTLSTNPSLPVRKVISDEYYVKTNVRSRVKFEIEKCRSELMHSVHSPFLITVKVDHALLEPDCLAVIRAAATSIRKRKVKRRHRRFKVQCLPTISTTAVNDALEVVTEKQFSDNNYFLLATSQRCSYEVEFLHKPIFIGGRYNKYSRTLPQTPWLIDGVRKAESSVEELICDKVAALVRASAYKFSSSGREDVDVRMLGMGRPFLVELINPQNISFTQTELSKVQEDINRATDKVKVHQLQKVSKEATAALKEGEQDKQKTYSALIWAPKRITVDDIKFLDDLKDLEIEQRTPIRVLHRRSLATRLRSVFSLQTAFVDEHHFTLHLTTQAGTYVKEFVHGDFGRTQPNLRVLLKQDVDILRLDVLEVKLPWPL